jgi:hypothetical protein
MLNVRKYLPSMEDFDSLPDTLANDISTDGENTYVAGIPEDLIKPAEKTEQDEEQEASVSGMVHAQKVAQDTREKFEESDEKKFEEEHPDEESTEADVGGDANTDDESQGAEDESTDSTQVEEETPKSTDEESTDDDEDDKEATEINYAIESYSKLLINAGNNLSHQSVEMLTVGLVRLHKQVAVPMVSNESFESGPVAARTMTSAESFLKQLQLLKESLGSTTNL